MAAFVAKQMIGNKMSAVKGMFYFCFNLDSEVFGFRFPDLFIVFVNTKHDNPRNIYCNAQHHITSSNNNM